MLGRGKQDVVAWQSINKIIHLDDIVWLVGTWVNNIHEKKTMPGQMS